MARKSSCIRVVGPVTAVRPGLVQTLTMRSSPPAGPEQQGLLPVWAHSPGLQGRNIGPTNHWTGSEDKGGNPRASKAQRLGWSFTHLSLPIVPVCVMDPGATHWVSASQCQSRKQTSDCPSLFSSEGIMFNKKEVVIKWKKPLLCPLPAL